MNPRILVVDDDSDIRETLSDVLQEEGFDVDAVQNGQEAIEQLRRAPAPPCAVLLDLMMPVMDGRTFLAIREHDSAMAAIPIIVITADGNCADVLRTFVVRDCLHKPFRFDRLMSAVRGCT